jgi:hypothetical protein
MRLDNGMVRKRKEGKNKTNKTRKEKVIQEKSKYNKREVKRTVERDIKKGNTK